MNTNKGKVYFDLEVPKDCTDEHKKKIILAMNDALESFDKDGERFNWTDLYNLPPANINGHIETDLVREYLAQRLEMAHPGSSLGESSGDTYCYPNSAELCYHGYEIHQENGDRLEVKIAELKGNTFPVRVVLAYEAHLTEAPS